MLLTHVIFAIHLWHRYSDYPHFRDGETEAKAELESVVEPGVESRLSPKYLALNTHWAGLG